MTMNETDRVFEELERRVETMLPEEYRDRYDDVLPVSMGSAGVRFGDDGKVAWNEMWGSFCDLAMAGGPPHKGRLLESASPREVAAAPVSYESVVSEICRGITMVTELDATRSSDAGWVRVECLTHSMASWLMRAITIENVAVRANGVMLDLPAGPDYGLLKEIKNVITVIAKTTHYWQGHMSVMQRAAIAALLDGMDEESALVAPAYDYEGLDAGAHETKAAEVAEAIRRDTGLVRSQHRYADWLGIECRTVRAALWMMRMMGVLNVVSRRENTTLFVPINPGADPGGRIVASSLVLVHRLAVAKGVL
jgi:sirohydrochlorin cobaltochelatase